jgi:hypothetical protein
MFLNSFHKDVTRFKHSLFLLFTFLVFVTLGNIPILYCIDYFDIHSSDLISTLKDNLGLDYLFMLLMFPFVLGFSFLVFF